MNEEPSKDSEKMTIIVIDCVCLKRELKELSQNSKKHKTQAIHSKVEYVLWVCFHSDEGFFQNRKASSSKG